MYNKSPEFTLAKIFPNDNISTNAFVYKKVKEKSMYDASNEIKDII